MRGLILFFFTGNEGSQTCSLGHLGTIAKPVLSEHVPALGSLPRLLRLLSPSSSSSTVTAFIKFSKSHGVESLGCHDLSVGMHYPYRLSHAPSIASYTILALETLELPLMYLSLSSSPLRPPDSLPQQCLTSSPVHNYYHGYWNSSWTFFWQQVWQRS